MNGKAIKPSCEYFLLPGYIFMSPEPYLISTVVGSSVAVALWDADSKLGGMLSFLYPFRESSAESTAIYGNVAITYMVRMFREEGAKKKNLRSQIFGGAESDCCEADQIAHENVKMARSVLKKHGIKVISEDVGGRLGRKIVYNTFQNEALIYKVNTLRNSDWYPYDGQGRQA
jgi:chemotaxis protein CheD